MTTQVKGDARASARFPHELDDSFSPTSCSVSTVNELHELRGNSLNENC